MKKRIIENLIRDAAFYGWKPETLAGALAALESGEYGNWRCHIRDAQFRLCPDCWRCSRAVKEEMEEK